MEALLPMVTTLLTHFTSTHLPHTSAATESEGKVQRR